MADTEEGARRSLLYILHKASDKVDTQESGVAGELVTSGDI